MLFSSGIVLYGAIGSNWSSLEYYLLHPTPIGVLSTIIPEDWMVGEVRGYLGLTNPTTRNSPVALPSVSVSVCHPIGHSQFLEIRYPRSRQLPLLPDIHSYPSA